MHSPSLLGGYSAGADTYIATNDRDLPFEIEQVACEHGGGAGRVPLRRLGNRSGPTLVHRLDEQGVPAVEELDPERLDFLYELTRGFDHISRVY